MNATRAHCAIPAGAFALVLALSCTKSDGSKPATAASVPPPTADDRFFAGGIRPEAVAAAKNPFAGDTGAAREGGKLFTAMNCDGCHGGGATGWVGPSLVDGRWRYGGSDGDLFRSIYYGRPKGMPAFGGVLPADGIWQLIAYIRAQPLPKSVPTERWP